MRDVYQVLYRKERQLEQLRKEVEVLKVVIPLLLDAADVPAMPAASVTVIPFERAVRAASQRFPAPLPD
ncbi:MAG TPA: hypothetical protein VJN48_10085 [Terriglobales bacterium]|nr:hypothetical protein [Terriglobales bacterium]